MIRLKAEASFDLDERRKVWIELVAECDEDADALLLAPALAEAVVERATQAYLDAAQRHPEIGAKPEPKGFQE